MKDARPTIRFKRLVTQGMVDAIPELAPFLGLEVEFTVTVLEAEPDFNRVKPQGRRPTADDCPLTVLPYQKPQRHYRRLPRLAFTSMASLTAGHLIIEFVIWIVLFYGLGRYRATTDNLFELERFQFAYTVEILVALLGGLFGAGVFLCFKLPANQNSFSWLHFRAFALGGLITTVPWLTRASDFVALILILTLTLMGALLLAESAKRKLEMAASPFDE